MAALSHDDKMGETAASDRSLEVSVSFGKFENDSLSWEKWSSFSPNKYLEEVEKCATPGSVAMKKAYFEAHYKKVAARKAEQLGQELQMEHESLGSDDQNGGDPLGKDYGIDSEFDVPGAQTFDDGTRQEKKLDDELDIGPVDEPSEDAAINLKSVELSAEKVEGELGGGIDGSSLKKLEEAPSVKEVEVLCTEAQEMKDVSESLEKERESIPVVKEKSAKLDHRKAQEMKDESKSLDKERENIPVVKGKSAKLDHRKDTQKISPMSKIRDMTRIKKKPASPVAKSPQISTPKVTRTVPVSSTLSTAKNVSSTLSMTKKATGSSLLKSKSPSVAGNKKVASKSLHMSLNMDTTISEPSLTPSHPTTVRTSLIMEKMKDKEIIKRAFKTFQNNFHQLKSSAEGRSSAAKQVSTKGAEAKVSSSVTPRKENAGSFKAGSMDKKTAKAAPSSLGSKSDDRVEKRKEFSKKLEEKSTVKVAGSTGLGNRSKDDKDAASRKLRQSLNFKATPTHDVFRGQNVSKSLIDKEGSKTLRI